MSVLIKTVLINLDGEETNIKTEGDGTLAGAWKNHANIIEKYIEIQNDAAGGAAEEKHPLTEVFDLCLADTLFPANQDKVSIDAEFAHGVAVSTSPILEEVKSGVVQSISSAVRRIRAGAFYPDAGAVINTAVLQATKGKGQRHGGDKTPFLEQPWVRLYKTHGLGFLLGQADKKYHEACGKENKGDAEREFLGAIVYLGMALLVLEGKVK